MSLRKEIMTTISEERIMVGGLGFEPERPSLERAGVKELCSGLEFMNAKRGGREPGIHQWGG